MNPTYIRKRLTEIRDLDLKFSLFGSTIHRYELKSTISESDVADYEKQNSISIPEDYRQFVTEIGNGGAGPFCGIYGLPTEWDLNDLSAPFSYTKITRDGSQLELIKQIDALDESDENFDEKYERLSLKYWTETNANGALHICEYGCALRFFLALNGKERGNIWFDATADFNGFSPVYVSTTTSSSTEWC
jgi:SMI1 / KNR4 family (SUKH-1)